MKISLNIPKSWSYFSESADIEPENLSGIDLLILVGFVHKPERCFIGVSGNVQDGIEHGPWALQPGATVVACMG